jgi:AraC-like DNA-binding protein
MAGIVLAERIMRVHLTRAATFGPICEYLEAGGTSVSRRLTDLGISPDLLSSPEALVPLRPCCRFVDRTISLDGIEDFGIEVGSRTAVGEFGIFGMVLRESLTLKDLIEKFIKWVPLVDSGARAWLESEEEADAIRFCIEHDVDVARAPVNEYALMLLIDAVRMAAGSEWRPAAVWLNRPGSRGISKFEALADAAIHYSPDSVSFLIPCHLLGEPVRRESSPRGPASDAERSLESTASPEDMVGSVSYAIRGGLSAGAPSLDEVADLAGTSRRGLQRDLQARGTSFRELVDRVRFEEAIAWLGNEKTHVSEIAYALGYTELSNFTHAFVRWTGISPTAYREERMRGVEK